MITDVEINYSKRVDKFLNKNSNVITIQEIRHIIQNAVLFLNGKTINIDLIELHGKLKGYYRIRKGNLRIVFQYINNGIHIVNIEFIGYRGDVYKSAQVKEEESEYSII